MTKDLERFIFEIEELRKQQRQEIIDLADYWILEKKLIMKYKKL